MPYASPERPDTSLLLRRQRAARTKSQDDPDMSASLIHSRMHVTNALARLLIDRDRYRDGIALINETRALHTASGSAAPFPLDLTVRLGICYLHLRPVNPDDRRQASMLFLEVRMCRLGSG
jgi:hypothetical protein